MGTILSTGVLQSILSGAVQSTGLLSKTGTTRSVGGNRSASAGQPDSSQLSPFAQVAGALGRLQQSNPARYRQVTQQIASNLANAAQAAGKSSAASQLSALATDFSNASQSGQLPDFQALFSRFQTAEAGNASVDPTAIMLNTLSGAGIGN